MVVSGGGGEARTFGGATWREPPRTESPVDPARLAGLLHAQDFQPLCLYRRFRLPARLHTRQKAPDVAVQRTFEFEELKAKLRDSVAWRVVEKLCWRRWRRRRRWWWW